MGIMVFGGTLYLYMKSIHYSYADINLFLSIFWIVGFITEIPSGVIADTFGRKKNADQQLRDQEHWPVPIIF